MGNGLKREARREGSVWTCVVCYSGRQVAGRQEGALGFLPGRRMEADCAPEVAYGSRKMAALPG